MKFKFTKMHGLGNDFMIIDAVHQNINLNKDQIQKLADRHRGVGFDQMLLIKPPQDNKADFFYEIYNSDGSESFQCGNGARCIAKFIFDEKLSDKKHLRIATKASLLETILHDEADVSVNMGKPSFISKEIPFLEDQNTQKHILKTSKGEFPVCILSMGNPHCVLLENIADENIRLLGEEICHHQKFPKQTNVEFLQVLSKDHIKLRVYERGAGETQACGSGACAAVVAGRSWFNLAETVRVSMLGGDLQITWKNKDDFVWMRGEIVKVFEGEINI